MFFNQFPWWIEKPVRLWTWASKVWWLWMMIAVFAVGYILLSKGGQ